MKQYTAQTTYQRKRRTARMALINIAKANTPCADCGQKFPPEAMDFDHVRGTKVSNVSKMVLMTLDRLEEEIAKCEIVCSNCHRTRTKSRREIKRI